MKGLLAAGRADATPIFPAQGMGGGCSVPTATATTASTDADDELKHHNEPANYVPARLIQAMMKSIRIIFTHIRGQIKIFN